MFFKKPSWVSLIWLVNLLYPENTVIIFKKKNEQNLKNNKILQTKCNDATHTTHTDSESVSHTKDIPKIHFAR